MARQPSEFQSPAPHGASVVVDHRGSGLSLEDALDHAVYRVMRHAFQAVDCLRCRGSRESVTDCELDFQVTEATFPQDAPASLESGHMRLGRSPARSACACRLEVLRIH